MKLNPQTLDHLAKQAFGSGFATGGVSVTGIIALVGAIFARISHKEGVKLVTDGDLQKFAASLLATGEARIANDESRLKQYEDHFLSQQREIDLLIETDKAKDAKIAELISANQALTTKLEAALAALSTEKRKSTEFEKETRRRITLEKHVAQLEEDKRLLVNTTRHQVDITSGGELTILDAAAAAADPYAATEPKPTRRRKAAAR